MYYRAREIFFKLSNRLISSRKNTPKGEWAPTKWRLNICVTFAEEITAEEDLYLGERFLPAYLKYSSELSRINTISVSHLCWIYQRRFSHRNSYEYSREVFSRQICEIKKKISVRKVSVETARSKDRCVQRRYVEITWYPYKIYRKLSASPANLPRHGVPTKFCGKVWKRREIDGTYEINPWSSP